MTLSLVKSLVIRLRVIEYMYTSSCNGGVGMLSS